MVVQGKNPMPFGRRRGRPIQEVLVNEKEYAGWLVSLDHPRQKRLTTWSVENGTKPEDMMNSAKLELPHPMVKQERREKVEGPWLMLRDPSPVQRPTAKRSMTQESDAMDTKSQDQESKIIDLLGDMKRSMDALTTRVQKVEEASSSNAASSNASKEGPPQPGEGARAR